MQSNFNIIEVSSFDQIEIVRELFLEYEQAIKVDLCFQNFKDELAKLPGDYAPPQGALLLAVYNQKTAGCIALRKINESTCEMKRLYIRPEFRGKSFGKELTLTVIDKARRIGYTKMRLDTLPIMKEAIQLYKSLGFCEIDPYRHNPVEGALFMELDLKDRKSVV
jgi:putative acetyltransferase